MAPRVVAVVKALYPFAGGEAGDLTFREAEIIRVTQKDPSGWWHGYTDDGREGDFPYTYVEEIKESEIPKVRTASVFVPEKTSQSQVGMDTLSNVKVKAVANEASFTVEAIMNSKVITGNKTMDEFRQLNDMLQILYPNFETPLPPLWSDKIYENEYASNKKAKVLETYAQKVVQSNGLGTEKTEYALVYWLQQDNDFNTAVPVRQEIEKAFQIASKQNGLRFRAEQIASGIEIAAVNYNWDAADSVELVLQSETFVRVRTRQTPNEGWWEGEDSSGARGIFPSTYVRLLNKNEVMKAITGQLRNRALPQPENFGAFNTPAPVKHVQTKAVTNRERKTENNFKISSLDAFDEMLTDGYTMLNESQEILLKKAGAECPKTGDLVKLSYVAYVWDCQKQRIIEFASSDLPDSKKEIKPLSFTVGRGETIKGLDRAVTNLELGQKSRVVIRPELGFGEVGDPPSVPPNCHLVYDITLDAFSAGDLSTPANNSSAFVVNRARRPAYNTTFHEI